jgi:hypothetical protein
VVILTTIPATRKKAGLKEMVRNFVILKPSVIALNVTALGVEAINT